jgi:flavin-dependent dehydrogenase
MTEAGFDADVLVAGGGPVGLGVALMATRAGFSTMVVERRPDPVDKACGEGLMPGALAALLQLGADPVGRDFLGIRYLEAGGARSAEARFAAGPGRGVRRTELHRALSAAADAAGVVRATGTVADVRQEVGAVCAGGIRARWLVAADGLHSTVRSELGLGRPPRVRPRHGLRQHFLVEPWSDLVEVHWSESAEAYVTPVGSGVVGVAVLTDLRGPSYDSWLERFPVLADRLEGAVVASEVRGAGALEQNVSRRVAGRVLLVGDAAGYVDALTGEGVAVGLAQARALVGCLSRGRPEEYERAWLAASRRYRMLTRGVLYAAQHGWLRPAVVPAASALPAVFRAAVNALA